MAKNTIADLDTVAANNTDRLGQNSSGTASANTLDTLMANGDAILARFYADIGGLGTVGGTGDAVTLTTLSTYQALEDGLLVTFKAGAANTGAATLNVDSLGAKAIRLSGDTALSANAILEDGHYQLRYDSAYNSSSGAWVLLNPSSTSLSAASTTELLTGTDSSKYVTADAVAALWEKGSDVASASTVTLGEGSLFHITGTTTITDIDFTTAKNGRRATLIFDAALTLTHNSTTLKLPGAANITTAAGDRCVVVQDSSDNVIVESYTRADGTAVVAPTGSFQPIPTSSTFAIGTLLCAYATSSGTLADGGTISGSSLRPLAGNPAGPSSGGTQTGTWTNRSGGSLAFGGGSSLIGYFQRTS